VIGTNVFDINEHMVRGFEPRPFLIEQLTTEGGDVHSLLIYFQAS